MENKKCVELLYQAASQARMTAQEHQKVSEAAQQLLEHFEPQEKKK